MTLSSGTAQLVEALQCIMTADSKTLSYFVETYGESDGLKTYEEGGWKIMYTDAKALLKERLSDAIELNLSNIGTNVI